MSFNLKFLSGPLKGKTLSFDQEEVIFGRDNDCDITLKDSKISGEHCGIFEENGKYILEDFESTNGTYVNTTKVNTEIVLKDGETIFIGSSRVLFKSSQKSKSKSVEDNYAGNYDDDLDDFDEDTNIKKIETNKGFKKVLDPEFYLDLKENFIELDKNKKTGIIAAVFIFFIVILLIVSFSGEKKVNYSPKNYPDLSDKILSLNNSKNKLWGYFSRGPYVDFSHPRKVIFSFKTTQLKKMDVYVTFTGVDYVDELQVLINNNEIMYAPITGLEKQRVKISVPLEYIKLNEDNFIEFRNKRSIGSSKKRWAIFLRKVTEKFLPAADIDQARLEYKKALRLYEQRKVSRGNRYNARRAFGKAMDFMELLPQKPNFYPDCIEKRKLIAKELNDIYINNKYAFYRAMKFQKTGKAKQHLYHIIEEIPDDADDRYNFAMDYLNDI